ncbi:serine protease [Patescibacteria group bacterium]|nr:MAG: serine protease [Patescibacteria group bacterium]
MMNLPPPHLPPPACDVARHKKWLRVKVMLLAAIFGLFAGVTGAAIVLGWIWPGWAEGDTWFGGASRPSGSRGALEERVRHEMSSRIISVYKKTSRFAGVDFLAQEDFLGSAIAVSSDGWLALYLPRYDGVKTFTALTGAGRILKIEKYLYDRHAEILYLKAKNSEQFKVVIFEERAAPGDDAFVFDGDWRRTTIGRAAWSSQLPRLDSAPARFFTLSDSGIVAGRVAANSQGRIIGLTMENSRLLPSEYITRLLAAVLGRGVVEYPTLGVEGWFSDERPLLAGANRTNGFLVVRLLDGASAPVRAREGILAKGDIILEIDGRVVDSGNLWYNIVDKSRIKLKILRQEKEMEMMVRAGKTK